MINLKFLIEKYGYETTRKYLQKRFSQKTPEAFWEFSRFCYGDKMGDETPFFHREIVNDLIKDNDGNCGRIARGAPRGGAKSTLIGTLYLSWLALNGFFNHILYVSDTADKAVALSSPLRKQIETNRHIKFLYPNAKSKDTWGKEAYIVNGLNGACLIKPIGQGKNVRGTSEDNIRPEFAILDDLENLELVYSRDRRKKLKQWLDFDLEPAMDRYHKNIVYVGTILHYHSLLNQVINKKGKYKSWNTKLYKAIENGKSFWESRFSMDYLKAIRDDPNHEDYVGSIVFSQEFQNEPQDEKDRIIQTHWLKTYNLIETINKRPEKTPQAKEKGFLDELDVYGAVDPAISEKATADNFALYIFGYNRKTAKEYMLDCVVIKSNDPEEHTRLCVDRIIRWGCIKFGVEAVQYQAGLKTMIRNALNKKAYYKCRVVKIKTNKDKIQRARIHSAQFQAGLILLREEHKNYNILSNEILEFPLGEHDDTFDSLMLARETRQKSRKKRTFKDNPLK